MKKWISILLIVFIFGTFSISASASEPYSNYTYDINGKSKGEPQAYLPTEAISGEAIGAGAFSNPKDIYVSEDRKIYVADTGNNRIVIFNPKNELLHIIKEFNNKGNVDGFNNPQGVFVAPNGDLYVADTGNERVVVFNTDMSFKKEIGRPESKLIDSSFAFSPIKVAVDSANRVYIASKNVTQGVVELDENGEFIGFMGAVPTKIDFITSLWRLVATQEQKDKMLLTVPTEYSSIDMDNEGFVYGVVSAIDSKKFDPTMFIRRLNPMGSDVLKRNGFSTPMGDVEYYFDTQTEEYETSLLNDVASRNYGIYSVLDTRKGRIFTYNRNGDLLYVFGAIGDSLGQFGVPEAIDTMDRKYYVIDSKYNHIVVFEPTTYGDLITDAVEKFALRDYEGSNEAWLEALKYTSKSDLAFSGIGKAQNNEEDYANAMLHLESANDRINYSAAFEKYRNQIIDKYFTIGVILIGVLVIGIFALRIYKKRKGVKKHD